MDKFDIIVIGHVGFENILNGPKPVTYCGGAGYYTSLAASLFSKNVGLVSRIGSDFDISKLKKLGINLQGVKLIEGGLSPQFRLRYNPLNYEQRDFECDWNVAADITPLDIPREYFSAKYFHIATAPPKQQLEWIKYIRKHSDAKISIDTLEQFIEWWKEDVIDALSAVDMVFINRRESELIGKLKSHKTMVIKKGPDGADYSVNGKIIYSTPAPKSVMKDPTGSGDIVAGVFLALMAQTNDYEKSLKEAVKTASKSIQDYGVDFLIK